MEAIETIETRFKTHLTKSFKDEFILARSKKDQDWLLVVIPTKFKAMAKHIVPSTFNQCKVQLMVVPDLS